MSFSNERENYPDCFLAAFVFLFFFSKNLIYFFQTLDPCALNKNSQQRAHAETETESEQAAEALPAISAAAFMRDWQAYPWSSSLVRKM